MTEVTEVTGVTEVRGFWEEQHKFKIELFGK